MLLVAQLAFGCQSNPAGTPEVHFIEIKEMKFQPEMLVIKPGDSVVWNNQDIVDHDITVGEGKQWTSGRIHYGNSWGKTIRQSSDYHCFLHQVMKGKIVVK